jgi:hypothetical protein
MILDHIHKMIQIKNTTIPFEDREFEYEQFHCVTTDCDYHEFKYLRHDEVKNKLKVNS